MRLFLALLLLCVGSFQAVGSAHAQTVAKVVGLTANATLKRGGKRSALVRNTDLQSGDRILTDPTGEVQIVFVDRTRVLVGPSSEFRVQNVRISSGKKASKFAVRALGGSFRFLSGDSDKKVYRIKTPSVTMGIRGTEFDFIVESRRNTRVVAFSGEVQVCNRRNRCVRVIGGCGFVTADRSGLKRPVTEEDRLEQLATDFPFVANQRRFSDRFRVATGECGNVEKAVSTAKASPPAPQPPKQTRRQSLKFEAPGNEASANEASGNEAGAESEPEPQSYSEAADES